MNLENITGIAFMSAWTIMLLSMITARGFAVFRAGDSWLHTRRWAQVLWVLFWVGIVLLVRRATGASLAALGGLLLVVRLSYQGKLVAAERADRAAKVAEAEQLRRQVTEARMAAMQAQLEPHFLFNTLATIDHLIETDPPRASRMQKRLIALLRATLPTIRESQTEHTNSARVERTLGQEVEIVTPYLEILGMRMEERLSARIDVPASLRSAACPPMILQVLVENAIRHGLEPKVEGGTLTLSARVVDRCLEVSVTDTGVGLGNAPPSAGAGTALANARQRLALLYGSDAELRVEALPTAGTRATLRLPYTTVDIQMTAARA